MPDDTRFHPTSPAQAAATERGAVADPERLDDATFVIPMATGIPFVPSTLCYVLVDDVGAAHVIDPGVDKAANLDRLDDELRARGIDRVASVTATHMHPDHLGLAPAVRERYGAPLVFGRIEAGAGSASWRIGDGRVRALDAWCVPESERAALLAIPATLEPTNGLRVDVLLDDGDELPIPGRRVVAMHTPGHTPGHLCFVEADAGRILTGDHVLPHINPGLGLGDPFAGNPVDEALDALDEVAELGDFEALPGHGYRFAGLADRCATIAEHHRARTRQMGDAIDAHPGASVWDLAAAGSWTAGWDGLHGFHRLTALAQTDMHVRRARARG